MSHVAAIDQRPQFCVASHVDLERRLETIEEKIENAGEVKERVAVHDVEIEASKAWQKRQNGSLQRIEAKIDKMVWWLIGGLITMFGIFGGFVLYVANQLATHVNTVPKP